MASMTNCESIANTLATKLGTTIKTKSSGTDTGLAWCSGTFASNLNFTVLHIDEDNRYNVEVNNLNDQATNKTTAVYATINTPGTYSTSIVANRAGNAWNGAQQNT